MKTAAPDAAKPFSPWRVFSGTCTLCSADDIQIKQTHVLNQVAQHSLILPQSRFRPNENIVARGCAHVCVCFSSGSKRKDYGKNVVFQTILRLFIVLLFHRSIEYTRGESWCFGVGEFHAEYLLVCRRQRRNRTSLLGLLHFVSFHK